MTPLKFLMPGWFALVMGLSGLALAWHQAAGVLGDMATGLALVLGLLAALVFVVLLIPVVGNVVVPLAGLPLGHGVWSEVQFGIGALLWPVVLALILARRVAHGPLPERIVPAWFITIAPPAVIGFVLTQWQAPLPVVLGFWGVARFFLLWAAPLVRRIAVQPIGVAFWALSFPLAAFTALTFRVAGLSQVGWLQTAATLMLAITSIAVLWLCFATLRGLLDGSLLAPEPVAHIVPAST